MSNYKDAALMIDAFPKAEALLGDKGYDPDWFRAALAEQGIAACIPSKINRKVGSLGRPCLAVPLDKRAGARVGERSIRFNWTGYGPSFAMANCRLFGNRLPLRYSAIFRRECFREVEIVFVPREFAYAHA